MKRMGKVNRFFGPEVLKYMEQHVRLNVYADDIANDLNLTRAQVTNSIGNFIRKGQPIIKVTNGVWRYDPAIATQVKARDNGQGDSHMLFEMIGASKQGKFVLQDESGDLYLAEKL